jgi:hypothetical protein
MKLLNCVTAYLALMQLAEREWNFETAHKLLMLKQKLQPHVEFYKTEEQKLAQEYGKKNEHGEVSFQANGNFAFEKPKFAQIFREKKNELNLVEIEETEILEIEPPEKIKPVLIEALYGFVCFKGGKNHGSSAKTEIS